jgi:predicted nucleotidyltransferase
MNEDELNMQIRKFLKVVGVTSQREIENAVHAAVAAGTLGEGAKLNAVMTLEIPALGLHHRIDGELELS